MKKQTTDEIIYFNPDTMSSYNYDAGYEQGRLSALNNVEKILGIINMMYEGDISVAKREFKIELMQEIAKLKESK